MFKNKNGGSQASEDDQMLRLVGRSTLLKSKQQRKAAGASSPSEPGARISRWVEKSK